MIYEAVTECPEIDRYAQHCWLESVFKWPATDMARPYIWSPEHQTTIRVRSAHPIAGMMWTPVHLPRAKTPIRFQIVAQRRCGKRRRSNTEFMNNLDWFERTAEAIGLASLDFDCDATAILINKPERPFRLDATLFTGRCIVADQSRFALALANGIANAKAYGLGFFRFFPADGDHHA